MDYDHDKALAVVARIPEGYRPPRLEAVCESSDIGGTRCTIIRPPSGAPDDGGDIVAQMWGDDPDLCRLFALSPELATIARAAVARVGEVTKLWREAEDLLHTAVSTEASAYAQHVHSIRDHFVAEVVRRRETEARAKAAEARVAELEAQLRRERIDLARTIAASNEKIDEAHAERDAALDAIESGCARDDGRTSVVVEAFLAAKARVQRLIDLERAGSRPPKHDIMLRSPSIESGAHVTTTEATPAPGEQS